ncbi:hypothetical protein N9891_01385 [bacterium]|nr:hypothetical protein [bacterium]
MRFQLAAIFICLFVSSCEKKSPPLKNVGSKVAVETAQSALDNEYYRYRVNPLGVQWKIVGPEQAAGVSADASGGAFHISGVKCLVIVEPIGKMDVGDYAGVLQDNLIAALPGAETSEIVEGSYCGLSSRDISAKGMVSGMEMTYLIRTFIREGYGYQVLGFHDSRAGGSALIEDFFDAFELLDGEITNPPVPIVEFAQSVGGIIRDNEFRSVVGDLKIGASGDWQPVHGVALSTMDPAAIAGLQDAGRAIYLTVIPEPRTGLSEDNYRKIILNQHLAEQGLDELALQTPVSFKMGGEDLSFDRFQTKLGVDVQYYIATFFKRNVHQQIAIWQVMQEGQEEDLYYPQIQEALNGFSWLNEEEKLELKRELASSLDPEFFVEAESSSLGGTYRSFDDGFKWIKGPGVWKTSFSDEVRAIDPSLILVAEDLESGISFEVYRYPKGDWDADSLHAASLEGVDEASIIESGPLLLGDAKFTHSRLALEHEGLPFRQDVITGLHQKFAYCIMMNHFGEPEPFEEKRYGEIFASLTFSKPEAKSSWDGSTYRDLRMGFEISFPPGAWKMKQDAIPRVSSIGSSLEFSSRNVTVTLAALSTAGAQSPKEMEKTMGEVMTANLKQIGSLSTTSQKLSGGIDSTKWEIRGGSDLVLGNIFTKGGIVYTFIVEGDEKEVEKTYRKALGTLKIVR